MHIVRLTNLCLEAQLFVWSFVYGDDKSVVDRKFNGVIDQLLSDAIAHCGSDEGTCIVKLGLSWIAVSLQRSAATSSCVSRSRRD